MSKLAISSITNINFVNVEQIVSLVKTFEIITPFEDIGQNLHRCKQLIEDCADIVAFAIEKKCETIDILFCFDRTNTFIGFHDELHYSTHCFEVKLPPSLSNATFADLSFVDKIKITAQLCMADENGLLPLPWSFLSNDQLLNAADMFGIKLTTTQVQNCPNISNALSAKIRKSDHFKNQYNKSTQFSDIYFDFSISNLFSCIGQGKDDAENLLGEFRSLSTKQKYKEGTKKDSLHQFSKVDTKTSSINHCISIAQCGTEISSDEKCKAKSSANLKFQSSKQVCTALLLESATPEQLQNIAMYYNIKIEIGRRSSKSFIIGLIKDSVPFKSDLIKSPIMSDVVYCFNNGNEVICTFHELTAINHGISLPKSTLSLYSPSAQQSLTPIDKAKVLLQAALATSKCKSFSVPWCVLTKSQKVAIYEDFCGFLDASDCSENNIDMQPKSDREIWNYIEESLDFKSKFGNPLISTLSFIGTAKTPLDISIQVCTSKADSIDCSSNLFSMFSQTHTENSTDSVGIPDCLDKSEENHDNDPNQKCGKKSFKLKPVTELNESSSNIILTEKSDCDEETDPLVAHVYSHITGEALAGVKSTLVACDTLSPPNLEVRNNPNTLVLEASMDEKVNSDHTNSSFSTSVHLTCPTVTEISDSSVTEQQVIGSDSENSVISSYGQSTLHSSEQSGQVTDSVHHSSGSSVGLVKNTQKKKFHHKRKSTKPSPKLVALSPSQKTSQSLTILPCDKQHIRGKMCLSCNKVCKYESMKCFICSRKVHYSCYKTQGKKALDHESFNKTLDLVNHKWFCNKCVHFSIDDILEHALLNLQVTSEAEKGSSITQDPSQTLKNPARDELSLPHKNSYLFDLSLVSEEEIYTKSHAKDSGTNKIASITPEQQTVDKLKTHVHHNSYTSKVLNLDQSLSDQVDVLASQHSAICSIEQTLQSIKTDIDISRKETKKDIKLLEKGISEEFTDIKNAIQLEMPMREAAISQSMEKKNYSIIAKDKAYGGQQVLAHKTIEKTLNQSNTVIITKGISRKYLKNSAKIKSTFNQFFRDMDLKTVFTSKGGSLMIELNSEEDAKHVEEAWDDSFFAEDGKVTDCKLLKRLSWSVVVKGVSTEYSDTDITIAAKRNYPGATIRRFITKDNTKLRTIKIDFQTEEHYKTCLSKGFAMDHYLFSAEEYKPRKRIIQCYKCCKFGHVAKLCNQTHFTCQICSKNHPTQQCNSGSSFCVNCEHSGHNATSKDCPMYQELVKKLNFNQNRRTKDTLYSNL